MNKSVTIIDVGSSKITALTGERGVNGTFAVHSVYDAEYEGFSEGKFFDESDFRNAVITALSAVVDSSYKRINEIFVGVPGAFIRIENRKFRLSFGRRKRVSEKDENDLIEAGKKKSRSTGTNRFMLPRFIILSTITARYSIRAALPLLRSAGS